MGGLERMMTKRLLLVVLLVLGLALAAGCARGGNESGTGGEDERPANKVVTEQSEELAGAVTDEQRERMDEIVAAYSAEQLVPERGECNVCHVGSDPWEQGDDLEGLVSSMVDLHTEALDPQLNAEVHAYFLQMAEERE